MHQDRETGINTGSKSEAESNASISTGRMSSRILSSNLLNLKRWIKARLISHAQRTASLRVYRQNRTDQVESASDGV